MLKKNLEITSYIKQFPPEARLKLNELYSLFLENLPEEAQQKISYGIPTFKFKEKNLIHFGGAKNHVAIYPGAGAVIAFEPELTKLKLEYSKGTIKFSLKEELPRELILKIINWRLANFKTDSQS